MSTASEVMTSTTQDTSPTSTPQSPPHQDRQTSSNLYLITFLATLFLLLFVSCAIVFRSYILRRRFQRHIDEAVAAGLLLTPRAQGSKKRRYGSKPKFHDAWLKPGGDSWADMMPVSAQHIMKRRPKDTPSPRLPNDTTPPAPDATAPVVEPVPFTPAFAWSQFWRRSAANTAQTQLPLQQLEPQAKTRPTALQIAVLIAMPNPNNCKRSESPYEEEEIPDVVFGITRLPYKPELDS